MVIIRKKHEETDLEKQAREKKEQERSMGIQDEYQARGFELVSWAQDHKGFVILFIIISLLSGAVFSGYLYYQQRKKEAASSAYMEAVKLIEKDDIFAVKKESSEEEKEKAQEAKDKLVAVGQSYSGAGVATLSNMYVAHMFLNDGDSLSAIEHYKKAAAELSNNNDLYPLTQIGLAYAQEHAGKKEEALSTVESLLELKSNLAEETVLWEAARLAKDNSQIEKANNFISRLLDKYPGSVFEKKAKQLKEELKN